MKQLILFLAVLFLMVGGAGGEDFGLQEGDVAYDYSDNTDNSVYIGGDGTIYNITSGGDAIIGGVGLNDPDSVDAPDNSTVCQQALLYNSTNWVSAFKIFFKPDLNNKWIAVDIGGQTHYFMAPMNGILTVSAKDKQLGLPDGAEVLVEFKVAPSVMLMKEYLEPNPW